MKMHTFWFECTDNGGGRQGDRQAGGHQEGHGVCKEACFG